MFIQVRPSWMSLCLRVGRQAAVVLFHLLVVVGLAFILFSSCCFFMEDA